MKKILFLLLLPPFLAMGQKGSFGGTQSNDDYDAFTRIISAGSVTSTVHRDGVNQLAKDLKVYGLYSSMLAVYPVAGGTSTAHSKSLISTTYNLSFSGGWTHASTGMLPNGSTGYANTSFNASTGWSGNLGAMGIYSRTNQSSCTCADMGASNSGFTANTSIWIHFAGTFYGLINCTGTSSNTGNTVGNGFYMASRTATSGSPRNYIQKNTTQTTFSEGHASPNLNLYIGALNTNGTAASFSGKEYTIAFIANSLTQAQGTTMYNIVTAYNTKMSR